MDCTLHDWMVQTFLFCPLIGSTLTRWEHRHDAAALRRAKWVSGLLSPERQLESGLGAAFGDKSALGEEMLFAGVTEAEI